MRQLISGDQQHDTIVHARAEVAERNATKTLTQVLETLRRPKQSHIDLTDARALRTEHPIATGLVLSLRQNRLTEISRLVANALVDSCPLLAEFDLSFSRLCALSALGRLAKLRWLSVRNNALVSLPAFAAAPLEFLDI